MPRSIPSLQAQRAAARAFAEEDWSTAAKHYRNAVLANPRSERLWLRLADCSLRAKDINAAREGYLQAHGLDPSHPQPLRGLARAAAAAGRREDEAAFLISAYERDLGSLASLLAAVDALPAGDGYEPLFNRLKALHSSLTQPGSSPPQAMATLALDISELILWYQAFRLPSGVQRVQLELLKALQSEPRVVFCRFDGVSWKPIDSATFSHLVSLSQRPGSVDDDDWWEALTRLHVELNASPALRLELGSVLVSLGSWVSEEFRSAFSRGPKLAGARYIPLIYDLIPIMHPHWFPAHVGAGFPRWLRGLQEVADSYITISESTKRDLIKLAAMTGSPIISENQVSVMRLDASFTDHKTQMPASLSSEMLALGILPRQYVLLVSTVEPRKNHVTALRAWRDLATGAGAPRLVCVGALGPGSSSVLSMQKRHKELRERVLFLDKVGDADLSALYENCIFTIYPSQYEGWGLPITESLCYGKMALAADNSSLREAGGECAEYFPTTDHKALLAAARTLIDDAGYLVRREQKISTSFSPRCWRDVASDLLAAASRAT